MVPSFLARFGEAKLGQIGRGLIQAIVKFDPETASEAQIAEFESELTGLTQQVAKLRSEYSKEKAEWDSVQKKYDQYLLAAERLQKKLDTASDAERSQIETSLNTLVTTLENLAPEVEREKQEAQDAGAFLKEFEEAAQAAATKVTTAKQRLDKARREMQSAELAEQKSAQRAEQAAALAGLRKSKDSMGTALDAMEQVAHERRQKAEAHSIKADLLTKAMPKTVESDPLIAEALGQAAGDTKPQASISERLAALKPAPATAGV
jgi:chromosome segregation ATPase